MKNRLILIRHAKSGWDDPNADDHERVLTARGRKAAEAIGAWLRTHGYQPDQILCSDAMRTRQTADHLFEGLQVAPPIRYLAALYHASPDTLYDAALKKKGATAIIGHNPGIGMFAHAMVKTRPDHHRFSDYPTCATTVIDFDGFMDLGSGQCTDFIVPRDLTD